jgi:hypothetical protein
MHNYRVGLTINQALSLTTIANPSTCNFEYVIEKEEATFKSFPLMGCVVTIFGYLQYCSQSSIVIITAGDYEYCESNSFRS